MTHRIKILCDRPDGIEYRSIVKGDIFTNLALYNIENIYIKIGTKAVNLRTGEEYSFDQDNRVMQIPNGTVLTIIVGEGT